MISEFSTHFEELRRRLLVCLCVLAAATVTAYFFSSQLLDFLTLPIKRYDHLELYFQKPYEAFLVRIKVAALAGTLFSSPVLFAQSWLFIAPGLYQKEKRVFLSLIFSSVALFLFGAAFGYEWVIPWGLHFLISFQTEAMRPLLGIDPYFSFLISMVLAFGLLFNFPVLIIGLTKAGILESRQIARSRKMIILLIFILAAVLTPSPDPISQILLAAPLWILFEISLQVASWVEKKR